VRFKPSETFQFGANTEYRHTVTLSKSRSEGKSEARRYTHHWSQPVKPNEALIVAITVVQRDFEVPFVARVRAEGAIQKNKEGKTEIGQLLSDEERTFEFAGTLIAKLNSAESQSRSNTWPLTKEECGKLLTEGIDRTRTPQFVMEAGPQQLAPNKYKTLASRMGEPGDWCFTASCDFPDNG